MTPSVQQTVQRHVSRLRHRLFLQSLLRCLLGGWAVAFLLWACWFLLQAYMHGEALPAWRWAGAAILFVGVHGGAAGPVGGRGPATRQEARQNARAENNEGGSGGGRGRRRGEDEVDVTAAPARPRHAAA